MGFQFVHTVVQSWEGKIEYKDERRPVVVGIASTGVGAGLAGAMLAGGVGAAAGNITTNQGA